ncbi:MAG: bis(5'-nucleosyl)-tetraphosphatase [Patescibacteria group bacterium]
MVHEKSVGAVIFIDQPKPIKYLVVQYRHRGWEFVRGHVERGESEIETARREIYEETGLTKLDLIDGFRESRVWQFRKNDGQRISKEAVFFLARAPRTRVRLNEENLAFAWLSYRAAYHRLAFSQSKKILTRAHARLTHKRTTIYA